MSRRPKVLLVQLPIPPLGPEPIRGNVPLAAAYLKLFARLRGIESIFDVEILSPREVNLLSDASLVDAIVERAPDLLGFTCYLWNIERTLWIAARVKEVRPRTLVLLGGPEVTRDNAWVLESPVIDLACVGEGEQTFAELLAGLGPQVGAGSWSSLLDLSAIPGLVICGSEGARFGPPRSPLPRLDEISSPYLAGILNAGDQEQLLLETIRGCIFKCKFCYYPKAYDALYFVSKEKVLQNLQHARDNGAREVYLLDPTLNQRRDFTEFLGWLKEGNPDGRLEYHAELRGEGINAETARLMREANFKQVEIGLQSIDPVAQELMDRRNSLKAFERGVKALQAEGLRVLVDLIVGLPGDTVDSVRRGMHYLAENRLYDDIQVFQLSVLPGTSFREEATRLGLEHQSRPPYYVTRTATLGLDDMLGLLKEAEEVFETRFDTAPPPALDLENPQGVVRLLRIDVDRARRLPPAGPVAQAFTVWIKARDAYQSLPTAEAALRAHLAKNPFSTVQIVLETEKDFPFDVFRRLQAVASRPVNIYLDRFFEMTPGTRAGATRIVTILPHAAREELEQDWVLGALEHTDLVWRSPGVNASQPHGARLNGGEEPGEWVWQPAAPETARGRIGSAPAATPNSPVT